MPAIPLTATWTKIASAGQSVAIQNLSAAPVQITTGSSLPIAADGLLLDALDTRTFALAADLYARAFGAGLATIEVMGGFTLPTTGGGVPFALVLPTIVGTPAVGQTLTATQGSWTGSPTGYAYAWSRAGAAIAGATSTSYAPVAADVGLALAVTVTATNTIGTATATSAPTAPVAANAPAAPSGSSPGGGAGNTADFTDSNNAYLAALAA